MMLRAPASHGCIPIYGCIISQVHWHMRLVPQPRAQAKGQVWALRSALHQQTGIISTVQELQT